MHWAGASDALGWGIDCDRKMGAPGSAGKLAESLEVAAPAAHHRLTTTRTRVGHPAKRLHGFRDELEMGLVGAARTHRKDRLCQLRVCGQAVLRSCTVALRMEWQYNTKSRPPCAWLDPEASVHTSFVTKLVFDISCSKDGKAEKNQTLTFGGRPRDRQQQPSCRPPAAPTAAVLRHLASASDEWQ